MVEVAGGLKGRTEPDVESGGNGGEGRDFCLFSLLLPCFPLC